MTIYRQLKLSFVDLFQCVTRSASSQICYAKTIMCNCAAKPTHAIYIDSRRKNIKKPPQRSQRKTTTIINQQSSSERQRTLPSIAESEKPWLPRKHTRIWYFKKSSFSRTTSTTDETETDRKKNNFFLIQKTKRLSHHSSVRNTLPRCHLSHSVLYFAQLRRDNHYCGSSRMRNRFKI